MVLTGLSDDAVTIDRETAVALIADMKASADAWAREMTRYHHEATRRDGWIGTGIMVEYRVDGSDTVLYGEIEEAIA